MAKTTLLEDRMATTLPDVQPVLTPLSPALNPATARTLRIEPPMTDAELEAFCRENGAARIERTREGVILMNPPAGFFSSSGNAKLVTQLTNWWETHRRGEVGDSSAAFYLPDGSLLSPDASYLTEETLAKLDRAELHGFPHICPDFVIELLSETDRLPKTKRKMELWMENGAALGWLIDPKEKRVFVYEAGRQTPTLITGNLILGLGPVAGFSLDLTKVWLRY